MQKYGRLTVLERVKLPNQSNAYCKCLCECGNIKTIRETHLKSGKIKSCGCLRAEMSSKRLKTHGDRRARLYSIWTNMKTRCSNPNAINYHLYGGRGIIVCHEWKNNYGAFRDWAFTNGYADNLTIDRKDNDKGYYPENCRWCTYQEQARNTSKNHKIEFLGEEHCVAEWAEKFGIGRSTLLYRINVANMDFKQAVSGQFENWLYQNVGPNSQYVYLHQHEDAL